MYNHVTKLFIPAEAEWWPLGPHEAELSLNEVTFKSNLNIAEGVYSIPWVFEKLNFTSRRCYIQCSWKLRFRTKRQFKVISELCGQNFKFFFTMALCDVYRIVVRWFWLCDHTGAPGRGCKVPRVACSLEKVWKWTHLWVLHQNWCIIYIVDVNT